MQMPKAIQQLIESFERLPGVGPKTAQRLTFYLLHVPEGELEQFSNCLLNLKKEVVLCSVCFGIAEDIICSLCSNQNRDHKTICVVEQPLDVFALEKNGRYKGVYHVLHGKIDPLNNIGPDEIYIKPLLDRIRNNELGIMEVILATNPTMEGEATAMYIAKQLGEIKNQPFDSAQGKNSPLRQGFEGQANLKISRIGRGLPVGADIEYADEITLQRAMEGRSDY